MTFQTTIAHSRAALPVAAAYGLGVLALYFSPDFGGWPQVALWLASVWVLAEANTRFQLLRDFSRMVSCSFIALSCMLPALFQSLPMCALGTALAVLLAMLLATYQQPRALGLIYFLFLLIALCAIVCWPLIALAPVCWLIMGFALQSMSWRGFFASLFGLLTPLWLAAPYAVWCANCNYIPPVAADVLDNNMQRLAHYADYTAITLPQAAAYVWIVLLGLIGAAHFLANAYDDKIRTRMAYYTIITVFALVAVATAMLPAYYDPFMRLLIVAASPLIGHFVANTRSRASNITTIAAIVATLALTAINLWMP